MDISKLNKADVLRVLYNRAQTQGMGIYQYKAGDMTQEEAEELVKNQTYFDYVQGRVMKIDLSKDVLDTRLSTTATTAAEPLSARLNH